MTWLPITMDTPWGMMDVVLRLGAATLLGALVGWDREAAGRAAGLRTHMLVSLGAAVFTVAALEMFELTQAEGAAKGDPTRIVEGIAQGIGFLGAGQILQSRGSVKGVTTAAGIWVVGAIGLACGGGCALLAGVSTLLVLAILRIVLLFEAESGRAKS